MRKKKRAEMQDDESDDGEFLERIFRKRTPEEIAKAQEVSEQNKREKQEAEEQWVREQKDREWESMKAAARVVKAQESQSISIQKKQECNEDMIMLLEYPTDEPIQAVQEAWDWKEIEAAIDTACVDNVVNPKHFPGLELIETDESKRGDSWTAAGGSKIPKLGEMKIAWQTDTGGKHGLRAKAGGVSKTLISGDRLLEAGYAVILNKRNPRLVHETTKEVIKLERRNRMFLMKMWVRVKVTKPVFTGPGKP